MEMIFRFYITFRNPCEGLADEEAIKHAGGLTQGEEPWKRQLLLKF